MALALRCGYCYSSYYSFLIVSMRARNSAMVKGLGKKYCIPASCAKRRVSASLFALIPMMIKLLDAQDGLHDKRREFSRALRRRVASIPSLRFVGHFKN